MTIKFILIVCGCVALFLAGVILLTKKVPLELGPDKKTHYVVNLFYGQQVYYRSWFGDGLGGSYDYTVLEGVDKNNVKLHELLLGDGSYVLLEHKNDFYLFAYKLPFHPLQEQIKAIQRGPVLVMWTEKRVFYRSEGVFVELVGAHAPTFQALAIQDDYFSDEHKVYYLNSSGQFNVIEGLSASTLTEVALYGYLSDGKLVVFKGKVVEGADSATFGELGERENTEFYATDKNHIYYNGEKVVGADKATFRVIGQFNNAFDTTLMRDSHAVFFRGKKVPGVDPNSAQIVVGEKSYLTDSAGRRLQLEYNSQTNGHILQ